MNQFDWSRLPIAPKGARWFVKCGPSTSYMHGFRNRQEIDDWFKHWHQSGAMCWQCGNVFAFKGQEAARIVSRTGKDWKP